MTVFALGDDGDDVVVAYETDLLSTAFFSADEAHIEHQRANRRSAKILTDAILYRGPAPHRWQTALYHVAGSVEPRHFNAPYYLAQPDHFLVPYQDVIDTIFLYETPLEIADSAIGIIVGDHPHPILDVMYSEGFKRASSAALSSMFDHFLTLQSQKRIDEIDDVIGAADVGRLAPEFMVGLLRINFPERKHLTNWVGYLNRAETELRSRKVTGVREILHGLNLA